VNYILIPFSIALLVYVAFPVIGAVVVLHRWRVFRSRMTESTLFPMADYAGVRTPTHSSRFRFYGRLEALEGKNYLWLKEENGSSTVRVDMKRQGFWLIPEEVGFPKKLSPQTKGPSVPQPPQWIPWSEATALTEGAKFFVYGPLVVEEGQGTFRGTRERSLMVVLYEGPPEELLSRSVWTGRQQNEYWNGVTPFSFILGFVGLLALAYFWFKVPALKESALWALALAVLPQTFFLPPGLIFFYFFNKFWATGRWFRAYRDMVALPFRYWGPVPLDITSPLVTRLPNGEDYTAQIQGKNWNPGKSGYQIIQWEDLHSDIQVYVSGCAQDLSAPTVLLGASPRVLHLLAQKKARRGELLAVTFFALGAGLNLLVLILLLRFWLL